MQYKSYLIFFFEVGTFLLTKKVHVPTMYLSNFFHGSFVQGKLKEILLSHFFDFFQNFTHVLDKMPAFWVKKVCGIQRPGKLCVKQYIYCSHIWDTIISQKWDSWMVIVATLISLLNKTQRYEVNVNTGVPTLIGSPVEYCEAVLTMWLAVRNRLMFTIMTQESFRSIVSLYWGLLTRNLRKKLKLR